MTSTAVLRYNRKGQSSVVLSISVAGAPRAIPSVAAAPACAYPQSILGRERFVDRIRRIVKGRKQGDLDAEHKRRELLSERVEEAAARVARLFGVGMEEVMRSRRGRRGNEARKAALWHAWERCAGGTTARGI